MPARKKKDEQVINETAAAVESAENITADTENTEETDAVVSDKGKQSKVKKADVSETTPFEETELEATDIPPEESDEFAAEVPQADKTEDIPEALEGTKMLPPPPSDDLPAESPPAKEPSKKTAAKTAVRKKTISELKLNELDRDLAPEHQQEWSAIYASYRSKSILSGTVIGADQNKLDIKNRDTGKTERKIMNSLIVIDYRVKVLIPESEMWAPGEERPDYVLQNMVGGKIDYVILEIDREGECAIGSRRMALAAKRHFFANTRLGHKEGDHLKCNVLAVGAKRCLVECGGYDMRLSQRDLSYTAVPDLREKYRPGQELDCILKSFDKEANRINISVKEVLPNPFIGADKRHPVGSRRQAVISGKYGGGVFCTLSDEITCLCLYSTRHDDGNFSIGDNVIIVIRQYDYARQLIYGRILSKW